MYFEFHSTRRNVKFAENFQKQKIDSLAVNGGK